MFTPRGNSSLFPPAKNGPVVKENGTSKPKAKAPKAVHSKRK